MERYFGSRAQAEDDATTVRSVVTDWLKRDQTTNRKYGTAARTYGEERIMNREFCGLGNGA